MCSRCWGRGRSGVLKPRGVPSSQEKPPGGGNTRVMSWKRNGLKCQPEKLEFYSLGCGKQRFWNWAQDHTVKKTQTSNSNIGTFCTTKVASLFRNRHYQERWKTGESVLQAMAKAEIKCSCSSTPYRLVLVMGSAVLNGLILPSVPFTQAFLVCPNNQGFSNSATHNSEFCNLGWATFC